MKRRVAMYLASFILVLVMILVSCSTPPVTTTSTTPPVTTTSTTLPVTTAPTPTTVTTTTATTTTSKKPQYGGTLTVEIGDTFGDTITYDAGSGVSSIHRVLGLVYERLGIGDWARSPAGTNEYSFLAISWINMQYVKGHLAESWEMPSATNIILHIRHGVHFQNKAPVNGRELTANDVAFCFNRYMNNPTAVSDLRPYVVSITATDKWTVEVKLKSPFCDALRNMLLGAYIYPPEYAQGSLEDWTRLAGTGPFILTEYIQGNAFNFRKNPDYWCYDEVNPENRLPYVDQVRGVLIMDTNTRLAAIRAGKLDFYAKEQGLNPDQWKSMSQTTPQLKYVKSYATDVRPLVHVRTDEKPFSDIRVRQALTMAINYQEIVDTYYSGQAAILSAPVWPMWGDIYVPIEQMPDDIKELYSYNPTKAKQLLKEAGYPDGFEIDMLVANVQDLLERAPMLQQYWKEVGIRTNIRVQEFGVLFGKLWAAKKEYHEIIVFSGGVSGPVTVLNWATSNHLFNWSCYYNPAYDAKVADLLATPDGPLQNEKIKALVQDHYRACIEIRFPMANSYTVWWPWVQNYHGELSIGGGMGREPIYARVWIDQALKKSMGY